ncbi:MAG TPA: DEAD/DEAH box helicase, partial [Anaerolineae bacterium]
MANPLDSFSAPVATWFRSTFGEPTPPQAAGWPSIQAGNHTLILAPTGSGKTLAAFLWGIDRIYRELIAGEGKMSPEGVRLLYVSPLKALNNDIERNLRSPLEGIRAAAARLRQAPDFAAGPAWPHLRVAVRTGDTPGAARAQMVRHPPHILITTPESLYLILTSPRARDMLRTVQTVIVDEIHTLCGNKRGVHLALTLERVEYLAQTEARDRGQSRPRRAASPAASATIAAPRPPIQRIGLSATQRPLDEVARFLGGQAWTENGELAPRRVTIIDTG